MEWPPLMLLNGPVRNKEGKSRHEEASEFICILVIKYFYLYKIQIKYIQIQISLNYIQIQISLNKEFYTVFRNTNNK